MLLQRRGCYSPSTDLSLGSAGSPKPRLSRILPRNHACLPSPQLRNKTAKTGSSLLLSGFLGSSRLLSFPLLPVPPRLLPALLLLLTPSTPPCSSWFLHGLSGFSLSWLLPPALPCLVAGATCSWRSLCSPGRHSGVTWSPGPGPTQSHSWRPGQRGQRMLVTRQHCPGSPRPSSHPQPPDLWVGPTPQLC